MISGKKKVTELNHPYVKEKEKEQERIKAVSAKHRRGLARRLKALSAVAVVLSVVFTVILVSQYSILEAKKEERQQLEQELADLQAKEASLQQDIKNYNDLDYIAEVARRDYYLTKPGETLFKLPESTSD